MKDKLIMRRQVQMHSRSRCKAYAEAKRKGKYHPTIPTLTPDTHLHTQSQSDSKLRYDWFLIKGVCVSLSDFLLNSIYLSTFPLMECLQSLLTDWLMID